MFNKLIMVITVLIMAITTVYAQPNWKFVGPKSNNNANGAEFETSQMNDVIADPNSTGHLFAIGKFGGLWERLFDATYNKWYWKNIDMTPTGLRQANAICIKSSTEILVGNYCNSPIGNNSSADFSNRIATYNFVTKAWTLYPAITGISGKYQIFSVAVHPSNPNVIYAGTSAGLYRFSVTTWNQLVPNCVVRKVFFHNGICYMSGATTPAIWTAGPSLVMASMDGWTFNAISLGIASSSAMTEICPGPTNKVYALTSAGSGPEYRYIHEVFYDGNSFVVTELHQWPLSWVYEAGPSKMSVTYDPINNWIWTGAVKFYCYRIVEDDLKGPIKPFFHTIGGYIHDDFHGSCISGDELFVAGDGGIASGILHSLQIPPQPFTPDDIYFMADNDSLNVSLLWGFSGSEKSPGIYAFGQQDIVNADIYDASPGMEKDIYTEFGVSSVPGPWENDGAFIDKYNENLVIFDGSLYGQTKRILLNGWSAGPPSANCNFYHPNASAPFSPNFADIVPIFHEFQRTVQDPYRPERIFEMGKRNYAGFSQFHPSTNTFVIKAEFSGQNFDFGTDDRQILSDLAFSPQTKNGMYVLVAGNWFPYPSPGDIWQAKVFKYNGPDIDGCWWGHNMLWSNGTTGIQQWLNVSPPYSTFHNIVLEDGSDHGADLVSGDRCLISKIEVSPWNKDVVYAAVDFGDILPNGKFSVLKYNGTTWSDYSEGIPYDDIPYSMEMDYFSNDMLYLVTDLNVYYRDAKMDYWMPYSGGIFPQAQTNQMEINYHENTLRAGTFGRGIWKTPLQCPSPTPINHTGTTNPDIYEASSITSSAVMTMSGGPTAYRGVHSVTLNPGFKADAFVTTASNRYFYAFIHGCSSSGSSMRFSEQDTQWDTHEEMEEEEESMLKAYPNPANEVIYVEFEAKENSNPQLFLCDISGKIIQKLGLISFEGRTIVPVTGVEDGVYFISMFENGKVSESKKVIVSH